MLRDKPSAEKRNGDVCEQRSLARGRSRGRRGMRPGVVLLVAVAMTTASWVAITPAGAATPKTWGPWKLFVVDHGSNRCFSSAQVPYAYKGPKGIRVGARAALRVKCKYAIVVTGITGRGGLWRNGTPDKRVGTVHFGLGYNKRIARVPSGYGVTEIANVACVSTSRSLTSRYYHSTFTWWPGSTSSGVSTAVTSPTSHLTTNCLDG